MKFNLNYNPSIESRSTDELLEIVSNIEDWNEDAVLVAQDELIKRGIKSDKQSFLKDITTKAKTKKSSIKENASYPRWYLIFMFLLPFLAFRHFFDNNDSVIELENEGYYRKAKQRFFCLLGGFIMWVLIIKFFLF